MNDFTDKPVSPRMAVSPPFRWVIDFGERMRARGDLRRENLLQLTLKGLDARENEPKLAVELYNKARAEAEALRESWWMLFIDYLRVNVITGPIGDLIQGEAIVQAAMVEMQKPVFNRFPQRVCLNEDLIRIRLGIDPRGFEPEVVAGIAYMERELTADSPCQECLEGIRIRRALELELWDEARERLLVVLAKPDAERAAVPAQSGRHLVSQKVATEKNRAAEFSQLCFVAWNTEQYDDLRRWAVEGEETGRRVDEQACIAECLIWQALLAQRDGDGARAQRLCHGAVQAAKLSQWIPGRPYFDALCAFHEEAGDPRLACQARAHQLNLLRGKGQTFVEVLAHIERCRLLHALGHSLESALPAARAAAQALLDPAPALAQLDRFARR